jgi:hypothetical protein
VFHEDAEKQYQSKMSLRACKTPTDSTNCDTEDGDDVPSLQSLRDDQGLDASILLQNCVARLGDFHDEISATLEDPPNQNDKQKKRSIEKLQNVVLPMMDTTVNKEMPQALSNVASIAATGHGVVQLEQCATRHFGPSAFR